MTNTAREGRTEVAARINSAKLPESVVQAPFARRVGVAAHSGKNGCLKGNRILICMAKLVPPFLLNSQVCENNRSKFPPRIRRASELLIPKSNRALVWASKIS